MTTIAKVVTAAALVVGALPSFADSGIRQLGLADAKKYAVEHNYDILALRRAHEQARAARSRTRSRFFPELGIAAGADSEMASSGNRGVAVGYLYGNWNLFSGFEDTYKTELASLETERAEIRLKQAEFRVGLDVEQVFHQHIFQHTGIELKQEAIDLNEIHRKMANQKRSAGLSGDADLIEFELRDATLRSDLLELNQKLEETRTNLRKLLGEEVGSHIEPVGVLQHQHLLGTLRDLSQHLHEQSEPILIATRDLSSATTEAKLWRARWLPKLDFLTKAGYLPLDIRSPGDTMTVSATVLLKFDFFNGFDSLWEKRELEAKRLKSEAQLKDAILSTVSQTENAFRRIVSIQARVDLEQMNLERAKKYYAAVLSEYRRGIKNSADVRVAAEGLFDVHLRREGYKLEFLVQRIALEKALGVAVQTETIADKGHEDHPGHKPGG